MINYGLINSSIEYYSVHNFKRIDAPWTVSQAIDDITRPEGATPFQLVHNNKRLVASGEQSFLYLYLKNHLPPGQFQTVTPCFRYEAFDFLHTKYFMKNELIKTDIVNKHELDKVVEISWNFFVKLFNNDRNLEIKKTESGFDIEIDGRELGSYGIRSCEFLDWIYATGCAEPRTSNLINLFK